MTEAPPRMDKSDDFATYADADSFTHEACEHRFTFIPSGKSRLTALLDHISSAKQTLKLFYYMFEDDESGHKVRDALIDALERGVEVALVIDAFGSDSAQEFFQPFVQAGGSFAQFSADWNVRYLVRNHQKFAVADDLRVMTGGFNVSDQYFNPPQENGWCDLGVLIEGEIAKKFSDWFGLVNAWVKSDGSQFRRIRRMIRDWDPGSGEVRLLMGGPLLRRSHWSYQLKKDLSQADRLDTVTAYFGPPRSFRRSMARVAKRGRVRLINAGISDIDGTIQVARLFYRRLLKAGVKIFEFQPCKLHMKLIVVDAASYFGSANLDRRSIRINIELMVRVEDESLAERLREFIDHLEGASIHADAEWYREHSSFFHRMRWRFFHWVSLLDYGAARAAADAETAARYPSIPQSE